MDSLTDTVAHALIGLPDVRVCQVEYNGGGRDSGVDAEITLDVHGRLVRLLVQEKQNAYPRDVRAMIEPLSRLKTEVNGMQAIPMLISPALPESSRMILRERRIAYGDSGGSLYLALEGIPSTQLTGNVFFVDKPVPRTPIRRSLNIFKGNTIRVLYAMLSAPSHAWHINELAPTAGVSPSTVHQVLQVLESHLWVESQGTGPRRIRVLREPGALLDTWRHEHSLDQYKAERLYGWAKSPEELRARLGGALEAAGVEYALTLSSGATLVAPFVTGLDRVSVFVPARADLDRVWSTAELTPVDEGANVTVFRSPGDTSLYGRRRVKALWVASDIHLYLDLWASPGRGKDQAEHLRRERLPY